MNIALFGESLLSAHRNSAATYFRGMIRALHAHGHRFTFYEANRPERRQFDDLKPPTWAEVILYPPDEGSALSQVEQARHADLIIQCTGHQNLPNSPTSFETLLTEAVLDIKTDRNIVAFWDVNVGATLDAIHQNPCHPAYRLIPRFDAVLTRGGGEEALQGYSALGAKECRSICNGVDPSTHFPQPSFNTEYECNLAFLGNAPSRSDSKLVKFLRETAVKAKDRTVAIAGEGWEEHPLPANVKLLGHVSTRHHNTFHYSAEVVLALQASRSRNTAATPPSRLFEAAGAGACIISDDWVGLEDFFEPDYDLLTARDGEEAGEQLEYLLKLGANRRREIGNNAFRRAALHHTYTHRAAEFDAFFTAGEKALLQTAPPLQSLPAESATNPEIASI